jgi:hypothetical protein
MKVRALGIYLLLVLAGCSAPESGARIDPVGPVRTTFRPVARTLERRCGSLDCHGSRYRNFRIYGFGGQRLDPADRPDTPRDVTQAEADATYDAFVGLEPEIMRDVVAAHGAGAEHLTALRKAWGDESHKAGRRIVPGDDADRCILGWIAGATDTGPCARASSQP